MKLLRSKQQTNKKQLQFLNPDSIRVRSQNLRHTEDPQAFRALAESIQKNGILQPIAVRLLKRTNEYELLAGLRRLQAAKALGMQEIPCYVLPAGELQAGVYALLENLQRRDLTFFEEAHAIDMLIRSWDLTQSEAAHLLCMAQSTLANKLRLLKLTSAQQESIENMQLSERHARALLRIADDQLRSVALNEVIVKGYTVEQTDKMSDRLLMPETPETKRRNFIIRDIRIFVNSINRAIDTMKMSGICAQSDRCETEDYIRYTVTIPKSSFVQPESHTPASGE